MVRPGTSPVEGIRLALSNVLSELDDVPNIQTLSNLNLTGLKSIISAVMIPTQYRKFNKYMTCYNKSSNFIREILGNKAHVIKLVMTAGFYIDIVKFVEENVIDMVQGGLLMEVKRLQVIHSQKGLMLATMFPKNTDLPYVQQHVQ